MRALVHTAGTSVTALRNTASEDTTGLPDPARRSGASERRGALPLSATLLGGPQPVASSRCGEDRED